MTRRTCLLIAVLTLAHTPALRVVPPTPSAQSPTVRFPPRLSGPEFFTLVKELSEPDGSFRSDNLVSNELFMQRVIPELTQVVKPGRAYLGVGPEQNYTYMAATRPAMAFIIDVRPGNLHLHLMYKALFELSADRADFVSRLFSLKRPPGLTRSSSVEEIFTAFNNPQLRSDDLYRQNVSAIRGLFQKKKLGLPADIVDEIEGVYRQFFTRGLSIHYEVTPGGGGSFPTYVELMVATDDGQTQRSFLASEDRFAFLKDLHTRNLIVPVVGDFAGPKAIRAVASYLRRHQTLVGAFYVSNVEQYLGRDGGWDKFCASVATLPMDNASTFIRSERGGLARRSGRGAARGGMGGSFTSQLHNILSEVKGCGK